MADQLTFADAITPHDQQSQISYELHIKVTQSVSSPKKAAIQMDISWFHF